MEKEKKAKLSVFKAISRIIPLFFKTLPSACILLALAGIMLGIINGLSAPANQFLFEALTGLYQGDGILRHVYIGAVLVTGVMLIRIIMDAAYNMLYRYHYEVTNGRLLIIGHKKIMSLPAQQFENSATLDLINMADHGKNGALHLYGAVSNALFMTVPFFVVMGVYLWRLQPLLLLAIFIVFVPVTLAQIFETGLYDKLEKESAPLRRVSNHYSACMSSQERMKETRLLGIFQYFKNLYMGALALVAQKQWTTQKKVTAMMLGLNIIKATGWIGVLALLFRALMIGSISVGAFAAVFAATQSMFNMVENAVANVRHYVAQDLGSIHNYIGFLDLPVPQGEEIAPDFSKGIVAKDVCFSYTPDAKPAVDGVSLAINAGETIALVGENGSGKTTLVKLLCGLYSPGIGQVLIGGRDASTTAAASLFSETSAVFQDYRRYALNLGENVRIGRVNDTSDPTQVLKDADIDPTDTSTFPQGLNTVMQRQFEGVELSGGQWQRIAMARGLYRRHEFIILDEPTAAIDPLEETRVYKRFAELTKGKIGILVTHRLGSARIADRIVVMDAGKIVETGTHEELVKSHGKYAEMWEVQAEAYA